MEPKSPSKVKFFVTGLHRTKLVLRITIAGFLISLLLGSVYFAFKWREFSSLRYYSYTVVVDCGSSGSRVNVFRWKTILGYSDLPVLEHSYPDSLSYQSLSSRSSCKYHCLQSEPGLDMFVGNATGVRASLEPLIALAEKWVPLERHGNTPIFVLATAGLRRLPVDEATRILDDVEEVLKGCTFVHRRSWTRVLSGKEEAYYGWVALNYKMGNLGNSPQGPTFGLLDLGGSSLQVVMEVDGGARDEVNLIRTKIGSVEHQILAYSLPSFGLNEAFDRTVAMLSQLQPSKKSTVERFRVGHPCLGSKFVQNYSCHACDGRNVTYEQKLSSEKLETEDLYLFGEPNWERCKEIAKTAAVNSSTLDGLKPTFQTNCKASLSSYNGSTIFNLTAATKPKRRFHALSGFFAVYNVLDLAPQANLTLIWEKGEQLCYTSWGDLSNSSVKPNYIGQYCFRVPYMASLIEDALCLGDSEIVFGPGDISWTLGAALIEGKYLWPSISKTNIWYMKIMEVLHSPIFVFLLLLCLLFVVYRSQIKLPMLGKKVPSIGPSMPSYIYPKRRPN